MPAEAFCADHTAFVNPLAGPHWNGWGVDPGNSRSQPADMAGLRKDQIERLKLKWAFGVPGGTAMRAQPTVAGGRLFFGSEAGDVYSIDAASGCVHWVFHAGGGVRTAISLGVIGRTLGGLFWWAWGGWRHRICGRCRYWPVGMGGHSRRFPLRADHRSPGARLGDALRAGHWGRGRKNLGIRIRVLQTSGKPCGAGRANGQPEMEDVYDCRTGAPNPDEPGGGSAMGPVRRGHLVGPDC